jgi:YbbR-like protein
MRTLTENLGWKLLSILIAAALWYGFVGQEEVATSVPVAMQFQNIPADLEVMSEPVDRLFLRLRGPAARLQSAALSQVSLRFDLAQIQSPGEQTFTLGPQNLGLPAGVEPTRIVPSQVRLTFERRATRELPVEVRYAGPPPAGYRVTSQNVSPETVRVIGPESRVQHVQTAQTDAIDLSSAISDTEFRAPVYLPDPQVRLENPSATVSVRVSLEKILQ